jgi:hypothetical protein
MTKRKSESAQRWRVTRLIGNAAREICEFQANSAEEAIKRAIKEFGITDAHQQKRLGAQRVA